MTLIELPDLIQGTDEWLEARRGLATASVVGKLITARARETGEYTCPECGAAPSEPCLSMAKGGNLAPIKTHHSTRAKAARDDMRPPPLVTASNDDSRALTALLVAERITGHVDPVYVSDDMMRGHEVEPLARDLYSEKYAPVRECGFLVRDFGKFRLGYSPDGLVGDDGLIEVKAPRAKTHLRTILSGQVPSHHMAQIQAGLLVTGRAWCDFLSYFGGMPMWRKRVEPDERWFDAITDAVLMFEQRAADMIAEYEEATEGLPQTERITYDDDIVIGSVAA